MGQVLRLQAVKPGPKGPRKAPILKGRMGGGRRPEQVRERLQPGNNAARGSKTITIPDEVKLLPRKPPARLSGYGKEAYRRIEKEQREWDAEPGCRAFVTASDLEAVVNYCRLYDRMQRLLEEGRLQDEMRQPLDIRHVSAEIRAIESAEKALRGLGYVPGAYNHLRLEEEEDRDADDFGD